MSRRLLDRLDQWKSRFEPGGAGELERLLGEVAARRFRDPADLIRLHETLLFLRAYPRSVEVARLADEILFGFGGRLAGVDLDAFEEPEISGIAGTSLTAVFSYEVAQRLAALHPRNVEIGWDRYDDSAKLGPVLRRLLPMLAEDWPVEAHVPFREWIAAGRTGRGSDALWLLDRLAALPISPPEQADLYASLNLPLTWEMGNSSTSRSRLRLPGSKLYCHEEPLLRRSDISLAQELEAPPLTVRRLARRDARKILDVILDTSAMRFRELYGFSHPDEGAVFHTDAGRGVEIYFFGVPPEWRLPLRAYHAGMFFKNGVPAGYVELLSLFERADVGFNLYYTFREGESAWLYARILRLFRQVLGVTCFSVDPYQIGLENPEAVDSGAFWFYRKLGFRPVDTEAAGLVAREERRMRATPGYRSSKRTLERLAQTYLMYGGSAADAGAWDGFRVRNLAMGLERRRWDSRGRESPRLDRPRKAMARPTGMAQILSMLPEFDGWTKEEKAAAAEIVRAKESGSEARYLRLMQRHPRLRAAFLRLGRRAIPYGA